MPALSMSTLGEYIRDQREQAEISLRQLARTAGVSNPYLSQIERGLRKPSADVLQQIAQGLRISAEALYVRAGLLEDRGGERTPTVAAAVRADPALNQRQRRALLDVYDAFRRENAEAAVGVPAPNPGSAPVSSPGEAGHGAADGASHHDPQHAGSGPAARGRRARPVQAGVPAHPQSPHTPAPRR